MRQTLFIKRIFQHVILATTRFFRVAFIGIFAIHVSVLLLRVEPCTPLKTSLYFERLVIVSCALSPPSSTVFASCSSSNCFWKCLITRTAVKASSAFSKSTTPQRVWPALMSDLKRKIWLHQSWIRLFLISLWCYTAKHALENNC